LVWQIIFGRVEIHGRAWLGTRLLQHPSLSPLIYHNSTHSFAYPQTPSIGLPGQQPCPDVCLLLILPAIFRVGKMGGPAWTRLGQRLSHSHLHNSSRSSACSPSSALTRLGSNLSCPVLSYLSIGRARASPWSFVYRSIFLSPVTLSIFFLPQPPQPHSLPLTHSCTCLRSLPLSCPG